MQGSFQFEKTCFISMYVQVDLKRKNYVYIIFLQHEQLCIHDISFSIFFLHIKKLITKLGGSESLRINPRLWLWYLDLKLFATYLATHYLPYLDLCLFDTCLDFLFAHLASWLVITAIAIYWRLSWTGTPCQQLK